MRRYKASFHAAASGPPRLATISSPPATVVTGPPANHCTCRMLDLTCHTGTTTAAANQARPRARRMPAVQRTIGRQVRMGGTEWSTNSGIYRISATKPVRPPSSKSLRVNTGQSSTPMPASVAAPSSRQSRSVTTAKGLTARSFLTISAAWTARRPLVITSCRSTTWLSGGRIAPSTCLPIPSPRGAA